MVSKSSSRMSTMDQDCSALAFFVRTNNALRILTLGRPNPEGNLQPRELAKLPHVPKSAAWSNDSQSLAVGDTVKGVVVISLRAGGPVVSILPGSHINTQQIWWSPTSKYLVTHHPPEKAAPGEKQKPNLLVWSVATEDMKVLASFNVPKLENSKQCPLMWTPDEKVCIRILPPEKGTKESVLHLLPGHDLNATPYYEIRENRACLVGEWCPVSDIRYQGENITGRLALFVSDGRNDMHRVSAPAEIRMYHCVGGKRLELVKRCEAASGELADLHWSASGDALLGLIETEVDETGVSYYGSTRLLLMSSDPNSGGGIIQELNKDAANQYLPIQAVQWSPVDDVFVLIRGFQPSHVSLWKYDRLDQTASMIKTLADKSHRNTVKWNKFGSVCLIGGFGNLAGEMDFYGMAAQDQLERIATCQANCTVSVEWSADGLHAITAVLAPRMRVENGFTVWNCLNGKAQHTENFEELFEVGLRPHNGRKSHFEGPQRLEIKEAINAAAKVTDTQPKRQAYRPPHARGETANNSVKAIMGGDLSSPSPRDRNAGGHAEGVENGTEDSEKHGNGAAARAAAKAGAKNSPRTERPTWTRGQSVPEKKAGEKEKTESIDSPSKNSNNGASRPDSQASSNASAEADGPRSFANLPPGKGPSNEEPPQFPPGAEPAAKGMPPAYLPPEEYQPLEAGQNGHVEGPITHIGKGGKGAPGAAGAPPGGKYPGYEGKGMPAGYEKGAAPAAAGAAYGGKKGAVDPQAYYGKPGFTQAGAQAGRPLSPQQQMYPHGQSAVPPAYPDPYRDPALYGQQPAPGAPPAAHHYGAPAAAGHHGAYHPHAAYHGAAQAQAQAQANAAAAAHAHAMAAHAAQQSAHYMAAQQRQYMAGAAAQPQPCPPAGWQYVDPKGNVQGPFALEEMVQWNTLGYFKPELKMRWRNDMEFVRFDVLFPPGVTPFQFYPYRDHYSAPVRIR